MAITARKRSMVRSAKWMIAAVQIVLMVAACTVLLRKKHPFGDFIAVGAFSNVLKAVTRAVLFVVGIVLYLIVTSLGSCHNRT
jgi:hypothetical protein